MTRFCLSLFVLVTLSLSCARAQSDSQPPKEEEGTFLGVLFGPIPDIVYDQLPNLPRGYGVAVTYVLPDSPAAEAGLLRSDILLSYDDTKIRDSEHFARLVRDDKPRKVKLVYVRGGKERTTEATLKLGPALKIAQEKTPPVKEEVPKALAKPMPVSVSAAPLGNGSMKVIVEYYQEGTNQLRTMQCAGSPAEIDKEIQKLPVRVQNLTRAALERIRKLETEPKSSDSSPSKRGGQ